MDKDSLSFIDIEDEVYVKEEAKAFITEISDEIEDSLYNGEDTALVENAIINMKKLEYPEYLSFNVEGHTLMNGDDLTMEAKWIARKAIAWKKIKNQKIIGNDINWINAISDILKQLFVYKKEVVYIYNYEGHQLSNEVNLTIDDLWFIVEMDTKWLKARETKEKIKCVERQLLSDGHEFSIFLETLNTSRELYDYLECILYEGLKTQSPEQIEIIVDKEELTDWLLRRLNNEKLKSYQQRVNIAGRKRGKKTGKLSKLITNSAQTSSEKQNRTIEGYLNELLGLVKQDKELEPKVLGFSEFLLANTDFIENLKKLCCIHKPKTPTQLITEFVKSQQKIQEANEFENINKIENESVAMGQEERAKQAVLFYSRRIAFDPRIRLLIYEYVKQVTRISTHPTIKGSKDVDIYDTLYPAKHINKLKQKKVKNDLIHLINEAELYDYVNYDIDTLDKTTGSDLLVANLAELIGVSSENDIINKNWDSLKISILNKTLGDYLYPKANEIIKKELIDTSLQYSIQDVYRTFLKDLSRTHLSLAKNPGNSKNYLKDEPVSSKKNLIVYSFKLEQDIFLTIMKGRRVIKRQVIPKNSGKHTDPAVDPFDQNGLNMVNNLLNHYFPDFILVYLDRKASHQLKNQLSLLSIKFCEERKFQKESYPIIIEERNNYCDEGAYQRVENDTDININFALTESFGAYGQYPLFEILNLWNEDIDKNRLINVQISPQHRYLKKSVLHRWLGYVLRLHISSTGVFYKDLEQGRAYPQASFLGGFGPKSSRWLDSIIKDLSLHKNSPKTLENFKQYFSESMWRNISGPLRLHCSGDGTSALTNPYDKTLIHPSWHEDTVAISQTLDYNGVSKRLDVNAQLKIVRDALNERGKEEAYIIENSFILKEILERVFRKGDYRANLYRLSFIFSKLFDSVYDDAKHFAQYLKSEEVLERRFYDVYPRVRGIKLEERLVKARIISICERSMRFQVYDDIPGLMMLNDQRSHEDEIKEGELNKFYMVNSEIYVKVMKVQYDLLRLRLTGKADKLSDHKSFQSKHLVLSSYNLFEHVNFCIEKETDFPKIHVEPKISKNFILRNINWHSFKNYSSVEAKNIQTDKPIGAHIFRPSVKSVSSLTLSWKIFDDMIINYEIEEGYRKPTQEISPDLTFENRMFSSLAEIEEHGLNILNKLTYSVLNNKHFAPIFTQTKKDQQLLEQRQKPYKLIYCLRQTNDKLKFVVLSYIDENNDFIDELIEFGLYGFKFHEQVFENIFSLLGWFKSNWKTKQYKQYIKENKETTLNNYLVIDDASSTASGQKAEARKFKSGGELGKREPAGGNWMNNEDNFGRGEKKYKQESSFAGKKEESEFKREVGANLRNGDANKHEGDSNWGNSNNNQGGSSWGNDNKQDAGGSSWGNDNNQKDGGSSWGNDNKQDAGGSSWGNDNNQGGGGSSWGNDNNQKDGGSSWGNDNNQKGGGSSWGNTGGNDDANWGSTNDWSSGNNDNNKFSDRGGGGGGGKRTCFNCGITNYK